jgi:hypothetical protein
LDAHGGSVTQRLANRSSFVGLFFTKIARFPPATPAQIQRVRRTGGPAVMGGDSVA